MAFSIKEWANYLIGGTEIDADALMDIEERLSDYADSIAAGGVELGHAEITSNATKSSATLADVAGLSVAVTVGSRPIAVRFDCGSAYNTSGTGGISVAILEDGVRVGGASSLFTGASNGAALNRQIRRAPSAGAHTYKVQLAYLFGGVATLVADDGSSGVGPVSLSVVEL